MHAWALGDNLRTAHLLPSHFGVMFATGRRVCAACRSNTETAVRLHISTSNYRMKCAKSITIYAGEICLRSIRPYPISLVLLGISSSGLCGERAGRAAKLHVSYRCTAFQLASSKPATSPSIEVPQLAAWGTTKTPACPLTHHSTCLVHAAVPYRC